MSDYRCVSSIAQALWTIVHDGQSIERTWTFAGPGANRCCTWSCGIVMAENSTGTGTWGPCMHQIDSESEDFVFLTTSICPTNPKHNIRSYHNSCNQVATRPKFYPSRKGARLIRRPSRSAPFGLCDLSEMCQNTLFTSFHLQEASS